MLNVDKCVTVWKRRKYANVEIDLYNNPEEAIIFRSYGANKCWLAMKRVMLFGTKSRRAVLIGSHSSRTCMFLHNITIPEADALSLELKEILSNPISTKVENFAT